MNPGSIGSIRWRKTSHPSVQQPPGPSLRRQRRALPASVRVSRRGVFWVPRPHFCLRLEKSLMDSILPLSPACLRSGPRARQRWPQGRAGGVLPSPSTAPAASQQGRAAEGTSGWFFSWGGEALSAREPDAEAWPCAGMQGNQFSPLKRRDNVADGSGTAEEILALTAGEGLPSRCHPARFPRRSPFHLGHSGAVDLSAWELKFWRQDCSSEPCIRAGSHRVFHKSLGFLRRPDGTISATAPQELRIRAAPCKSRV